MAQATVARPITPAQQKAADELLALSSRWARGVRHEDGLTFVTFTSSHLDKDGQPIYYYTSERGCTCLGFANRGRCCHSIAVLADLEHQAVEERVTPLRAYRDLFPGCAAGCGELVERQNQLCYQCASDAVHQQRIASRRATTKEAWL